MIPTPLNDLDELVLAVRDGNSRIYIGEAVHAYRNGLGRAAIILTWTALAYDLIAKYRELADQGEAAAQKFVTDLDDAIKTQNISKLQQIENEIINLARDPFELIDDREHTALVRLKEDRNHCAHPAFTGDSLLYSPLPELVRAHIVQSVKSVLQHAPLQGKSAFARLKVDLLQSSFPIAQAQVTTFLQSRYFNRLKHSLIGRVITILTKELILQPDPDLAKVPENVARALVAASQTHPKEYEQGMRSDLPKFAGSAEDDKLWRILLLLGNDARIWDWLDKPTQIKIEGLLKGKVSADQLSLFRNAINVSALAPLVESRYQALDDEKKERFIAACPIPIVVKDALRLFGDSGSFRTAEARGRNLLLSVAPTLKPEEIRKVLDAVLENGQIWHAAEIPEILKHFFGMTKHHLSATRDDWKAFLGKVAEKRDSEHWTDLENALGK